ncbi:efflux RND transporter periplasmic adaptor subunit [Neorhodopirellula pilleata]|uniref:Putative acetyl-CoA carboxylase biotin carboxyl carrier protein subunit n=1 Tax=Neorhodopirellula pilleata TaxID=2714738 RepID=A0A5C6AVU3_9BACT|nr:biotin/lipoyl-binding protein [Neorhodopirellula pilleata]TWU03607.1 putative acetyl-CoA carboxylase biotin carboxyl carrier protein subunit [Neorhodopirellula pilleata]
MSVSVTHIDERLDELERLRCQMAPEAFLNAVIGSLCDVLGAHNVVAVHPINDDYFVSVAAARHPAPIADSRWVASQLGTHRERSSSPDSNASTRRWIGLTKRQNVDPADGLSRTGCSLSPSTWRYGGIVITWPSHRDTAIEGAMRGIIEAFAEIAFAHYLETFVESQASRSRELAVAQDQLLDTDDDEQATSLLVGSLSSLLPADRVCLLSMNATGEPRLLAVGGVDDLDRRTEAVKRIEAAAVETTKTRQPNFSVQSRDHFDDANALGPAGDESHQQLSLSIPWDGHHVLLLQWASEARLATAAVWLQATCHSLQSTWHQTKAWHRVPKWLRSYLKRSSHRSSSKPMVRWATGISVLGVMAIVAMYPITFSIIGEGTLEPIDQRWIFASQEGFVRELKVADGDQVQTGDVIAILESSELEIQISEVAGRIREVQTQRQGIEITINQLVRSAIPDPALENRLQSELKELAIRLDSLNEQAGLLEAQRELLQIVSPIDGKIIGWEIERNLLDRPVSRGDVLMRVANTNAPWRIELLIPDRDAGYLERYADQVSPRMVVAEYALRSDPQTKHSSEVTWVSPEVVHDPSQGAVVEVHLGVEQGALPRSSLGATVDGRLICGTKPRWFVWGRPIWEAIQRRIWF